MTTTQDPARCPRPPTPDPDLDAWTDDELVAAALAYAEVYAYPCPRSPHDDHDAGCHALPGLRLPGVRVGLGEKDRPRRFEASTVVEACAACGSTRPIAAPRRRGETKENAGAHTQPQRVGVAGRNIPPAATLGPGHVTHRSR
jgi:hypothetical protein